MIRCSSRTLSRCQVLTLAGLVGSSAACAHAPKAAAPAPEVLTYEVEYGEQTVSSAKLVFPWELSNPTPTEARIESIEWKLALDSEADLTGNEAGGVVAAPASKAEGKLSVAAKITTTDAAFVAREAMDGMRFTLTATFTVAAAGNTDTFEAEWTGELFPPKRPTVSVRPQAVRSPTHAELNFTLIVTNPNPFAMRADVLEYVLKVADTELLSGAVGEGRILGPGTDTEFDVSKQVDKKSFPTLWPKVASARTIGYTVDWTLKSEGLDLKSNLPGDIQFSK